MIRPALTAFATRAAADMPPVPPLQILRANSEEFAIAGVLIAIIGAGVYGAYAIHQGRSKK